MWTHWTLYEWIRNKSFDTTKNLEKAPGNKFAILKEWYSRFNKSSKRDTSYHWPHSWPSALGEPILLRLN